MKKSFIVQAFEMIARLLVVAGIASVTWYSYDEADAGLLPWQPYAAFALLIAATFLIYGIVDKGQPADEEIVQCRTEAG